MSVPRFFSENLAGQMIDLQGQEAHHLANVRRVRAGEEVELFDGRGEKVKGKVSSISKGVARIEVQERWTVERSETEMIVACALAKGTRWGWLLEKCTELGAAGIWPVLFQRSVVKGSGSAGQLEKWQKRCLEAAKQCGQAYLPQVAQPRPLERVLREEAALRLLGTLSESSQAILAALQEAGRTEKIMLLVGPEGGLTDEEQALARDTGCREVFIGRNILRVETAAVAMLAAAVAWQDWGRNKAE